MSALFSSPSCLLGGGNSENLREPTGGPVASLKETRDVHFDRDEPVSEDSSPNRTGAERHPPKDNPRYDRAEALRCGLLKVDTAVGDNHDPDRTITDRRAEPFKEERAKEKLERDELEPISELPDEEISPAPSSERIEGVDLLKVRPVGHPEDKQ